MADVTFPQAMPEQLPLTGALLKSLTATSKLDEQDGVFARLGQASTKSCQPVVFSFDVEEHDRIEAAANLPLDMNRRRLYGERMERSTEQLLDLLAEFQVRGTFYIVGQIARTHPRLVRRIAARGHEIGSHGWDHSRLNRLTPSAAKEDLRRSKLILEQVSGQEVLGYRAPTFSLSRDNGWAVDRLVEAGYRYDSSVFPICHDRYGIPDAPRTPFIVEGRESAILELPLATFRKWSMNLPVAGGGYFRLFPSFVMNAGVKQLLKMESSLAMLYFHPWEFDPTQPRLPLNRLSHWRTYVGMAKSTARLRALLARYATYAQRACDCVETLVKHQHTLPRLSLDSDRPIQNLPLSTRTNSLSLAS